MWWTLDQSPARITELLEPTICFALGVVDSRPEPSSDNILAFVNSWYLQHVLLLGVVDPGPEPRPDNILAFVNCGRSWDSIHCEAIQYRGSVFYLTTREIPCNVEILVYYGDDYAKMINIEPSVGN